MTSAAHTAMVRWVAALALTAACGSGAASDFDRGLPVSAKTRIAQLSKDADQLAAEGRYGEAGNVLRQAIATLPQPAAQWDTATWLHIAAGDAEFLAGNYKAAKDALTMAARCPGGFGVPFLHLRLGQAEFEMGDMKAAETELARAYIPDGVEIFKDEDPKYLAYIKSRLRAPPAGWPAGW